MQQKAPEQPRWYRTPEEFDLPIEAIEKGPFAEEVAISVRINGGVKSAFVPASAVDQKKKTVKAAKVGEIGSFVLVSLPPGSMGRTTLLVAPQAIPRNVSA
ncbi:MAG: hypothetical protein HY531_03265 [Chloroflexi bacterium]|nr:hypothetical protein [Chloroflexota bacterium]